MPKKRDQEDTTPNAQGKRRAGHIVDPLVTVETQREADLLSGAWAERTFVKLYVAARESGLLAAISDRDWKTLCTLATYMDGEGYCHPSQAELARAMGCSRQMANERVRSLANFRFRGQQVLLVAKEDRTVNGEWARNGYRVLPISRLRIYDAGETPEQTDSGNDTMSGAPRTVSSRLDTVDPTVSSRTVTVRLDTNKKHPLEQEGNPSKFEGSHDGVERTGTTPGGGKDRARRATPDPADSSAPFAGLRGTTEEREQLAAYLGDFSRELGDEAPLSSTITRVLNVFKAADVPPGRWGDHLYRARAAAQEHTAQIRKEATSGASGFRRKNKMPYFLAVLEQLVGLRPAPAAPSSRGERAG